MLAPAPMVVRRVVIPDDELLDPAQGGIWWLESRVALEQREIWLLQCTFVGVQVTHLPPVTTLGTSLTREIPRHAVPLQLNFSLLAIRIM